MIHFIRIRLVCQLQNKAKRNSTRDYRKQIVSDLLRILACINRRNSHLASKRMIPMNAVNHPATAAAKLTAIGMFDALQKTKRKYDRTQTNNGENMFVHLFAETNLQSAKAIQKGMDS